MQRAWAILTALLITLSGAALAQGQDLAGVYRLSRPGTVLTLVIKTDAQGRLSGSLSSTTGARFTLSGVVQQGVGTGRFTGQGGGSFFRAQRRGELLRLSLMEPDAQGKPDPRRARHLVLTRQNAPAPPAAAPAPTARPFTGLPDKPTGQPPAAGRPAPATGELGHPQWGFAFRPPGRWQHRMLPRGVLLGHGSIAGAIIVLPHTAASLQEVQAEMLKGINQGNTRMSLVGPLRRLGSNALEGDYQGFWEGQPARGRGIGTFSPYSGGAMIVAVTTPEKFGRRLSDAARAIARGLRYFKVDVADLVKHFAGYWWRYSGTSALSHETLIYLGPDGTFRDRHEDAANLANRDRAGNVTSQYLGQSQGKGRGRWTVRGTKEQGVILVRRADGSSMEIAYRVKPSRPQKYGAYYFNGRLYHWVTPKQLRDIGY